MHTAQQACNAACYTQAHLVQQAVQQCCQTQQHHTGRRRDGEQSQAWTAQVLDGEHACACTQAQVQQAPAGAPLVPEIAELPLALDLDGQKQLMLKAADEELKGGHQPADGHLEGKHEPADGQRERKPRLVSLQKRAAVVVQQPVDPAAAAASAGAAHNAAAAA